MSSQAQPMITPSTCDCEFLDAMVRFRPQNCLWRILETAGIKAGLAGGREGVCVRAARTYGEDGGAQEFGGKQQQKVLNQQPPYISKYPKWEDV